MKKFNLICCLIMIVMIVAYGWNDLCLWLGIDYHVEDVTMAFIAGVINALIPCGFLSYIAIDSSRSAKKMYDRQWEELEHLCQTITRIKESGDDR